MPNLKGIPESMKLLEVMDLIFQTNPELFQDNDYSDSFRTIFKHHYNDVKNRLDAIEIKSENGIYRPVIDLKNSFDRFVEKSGFLSKAT